MFELQIEGEFCAAHAISTAGEREPMHGHNWHVTIVVGAESLDDDGLVCDFHELERALQGIVAPLHNANLNETPPFDERNPTAEVVAQQIGDAIAAQLPPRVRLVSATVTEAPGCAAVYRP